MCGIVAYWGKRRAWDVLITGLKRLEYRGYDSAGVALSNSTLRVYKCKGKVSDLENSLQGKNLNGHLGIGHTRWASHGEPNDVNAHPHYSAKKDIVVVHNGIIENYNTLKEQLTSKGYTFRSDTDTEIIAYLIEDIRNNEKCTLDEAVRLTLNEIVGAYALVVIDAHNPHLLVMARKGSPLVIGVGDNEYFVASDTGPIIGYTKEVIYLNDDEIATIQKGKLAIKSMSNLPLTPYVRTLNMELNTIEKGKYKHFMLKEIYEQPRSIRDCMRGRLQVDSSSIVLRGIQEHLKVFVKTKRIIIVACGTSWHAGLTAEYFFEELCRIPVEVEYASEFRYRNPVIEENDVVIAISQSGETADTLAAIELAQAKKATIFGVCNVVGSSIARATQAGVYTHAGPEIGVASTKAFTAQLIVLYMIALVVADEKKSINSDKFHELLAEMDKLPAIMEQVLSLDKAIFHIAQIFKEASNFIYLGRGYNFPVALEGALKLKEISYIHAEGYPAAEMKHGPIALIDEDMPVVVIATRDRSYDKIVSNVQEVKARKGKVIAIVSQGDNLLHKMVNHIIEVPQVIEPLAPLIAAIPLQLLSYHIATLRGCDVDQPRNLAKSVTVE